jgi:hypothetical protein
MLKKLSRYLTKKGISDTQLLQLVVVGGLALFTMIALIYGAIGAMVL